MLEIVLKSTTWPTLDRDLLDLRSMGFVRIQTSPILLFFRFRCRFSFVQNTFGTTRRRRHPGVAWQHGHGPEDLPKQQLHRGDPSSIARQPLKSQGKSKGSPNCCSGLRRLVYRTAGTTVPGIPAFTLILQPCCHRHRRVKHMR